MKSQKLMLAIFAGLFFISISACRKSISDDNSGKPKKMEDLKVASNFNWESSREVNITIASVFPEYVGKLARVSLYNGNPAEQGQILLTGSTGYNFPFVTKLRIPTALTQLYFKLDFGDGNVQLALVNVADEINYTFSSESVLKEGFVVGEPDCNTGCDITVTGNSVTIKNGQTYCITSPFTGTVNFEFWNGGGTLKICSTANISSINNMGGTNCAILVTAGGTLTTSGSFAMNGSSGITIYPTAHAHFNGGINMNQSTTSLTNYANDFTIGQSFAPNGPVINYGNMIINGNFTLNSGSSLTNNGIFYSSGSFEANKNVTNTGSMAVQGNVSFNANSIIQNNCKWIIHGNLSVNPTTLNMNNGYLKVDGSINLNSGAMNLTNQSQVSAGSMTLNSNGAYGSGSLNSIKVTTATINSATVNGAIEFATQSGSMNNWNASKFTNGATLVSWANIQNFIPVTDCNPEGIGDNPQPTDTDGDGVPDSLDDYPLDPTRAFNNYYPAKDVFGSLAFEDLWPAKGDYDMNDLVVDYNYWYVTNAQNKVVDVKPTFYVRAVGAFLQNGFAWQFDGVLPADVESVTGYSLQKGYITLGSNGVENNQEKAVVIVFDNAENVIHRVGGAFFNTENNGLYGISDSLKINLHFAIPQEQTAVGTPPYNPFLIKNMARGIEIHLPDKPPTSLVDASFFGTIDDDSDPLTGRYYKTSRNLPWAINIPVKFDYTWEMIQIVYGHLKFGTWAESSGVQYPDWYKNLPGYRDPAQIYRIPE